MTPSLQMSELGARALREEPVITRLMTAKLRHPNLLSLAAGFTDDSMLPIDDLAEAARRLAQSPREGQAALQYGLNAGRVDLREGIVRLLCEFPGEENLDIHVDDVLVTVGSQQALYMSAQILCNPGDIVLVEAPSYFVFLELLAGLGIRAVSMPTDQESGRIQFDALRTQMAAFAESGELGRVKLVYFMGVFANPSARCFPEVDKLRLREVLGELPRRIPVIEDMAYRELYFDEPDSARSVLSIEEWRDWPVIYTGSFSKSYASGVRNGFLITRCGELRRAVACVKGHQDFGSPHFAQALQAEILRSGRFDEQMARVRPHYKQKARLLENALIAAGLRDLGWRWAPPGGGLLLWVRAPAGFDTRLDSPFYKACREQEVLYVPGDLCFAEGSPYNCVRLSFGALAEDKLEEAARRFVAAARSIQAGT